MMRNFKFALFAFSVLLLLSCHSNKSSVKTSGSNDSVLMYEYLQMERRGGGDKLFNLYPTDNKDMLKAEVLRYNFRDTSVIKFIPAEPQTDSLFSLYYGIMAGEIAATETGDMDNRNLLTGTWSYYYAVKDSVRTEITNREIKNALSEWENILNYILSE